MFQSQRLKFFFLSRKWRRWRFTSSDIWEIYCAARGGPPARPNSSKKCHKSSPLFWKKKKKLVKNVHKKWFDCQLTFPVAPLFFCCNFRAKRTDIFCWPCQCWPSCYEEEPVVVAGTRFMEWQHQQQQAPSWKIFYKYIAQHRAGRRKFQTCLLSRRRAAQKNCSSKVWKISSTSLRRLFAYQMNRMAASWNLFLKFKIYPIPSDRWSSLWW